MRKMFHFMFWVALVLGVLIGVGRATVIRWWRVPSSADDPYFTASISPSVHGGDLIVLWRGSKPGFGDLVMCPEPKHPERVVIARLIGEQGDEIAINGAEITVNNKPLRTESNCPTFKENDPGTGVEVEQHCSIETVGGGTHSRGELVPSSAQPREVAAKVAPGQVWLVSDNRQFPWDSREFGPVDRDTCTETVFFRLVGSGGFFDASHRNQYIH